MNLTQSQPYWTPDTFENLVGKLVHPTRFTQNFKESVSRIGRKAILNRKDGCKLLKVLFEDSKMMKDLYGSPEELMHDLEVIQNFPNNSEFLGFPNGQLNYLAIKIQMKDTEGIEFCSKIEAFEGFYKNRMMSWQQYLMAKSIGNRLGREMKDSFEFIPINLFEERINIETLKYISCFETHQHLPPTITDFKKFVELCSEIYDKENDIGLLEELRELLEQQNNTSPFSSNQKKFLDFYNSQLSWKYALEQALGFEQSSSHWFKRKYPVVRVFQNDNQGFMMSKELENALNVAMMNKFGREFPKEMLPSESAKDRDLGIVRAIEWKDSENVLKTLGLSVYDIHIINYDLAQTSRDIPVPINTPFGTYCTLAKHAFWNIFERIILEVGPVSKENYSKIFKWFAQFDDVFSSSREYRYFVETWKIEEIIDKAYKEVISETPRNEKRASEDLNVAKKRFLDQNPKFIRFVINQGICVRPGRFYDLVKKIKNPTTSSGDSEFVRKHRRAFMKVIQKIPDDRFIPRPIYEKWIDQEMDDGSLTIKIDLSSNLDFMKLLQLEAEYLEFQGPAKSQLVRRKKVPQKNPMFDGKAQETMSKAIFTALAKGDFSRTEGTKENVENFMKNNFAQELAGNLSSESDEMTKKALETFLSMLKK